MQVLLNPSKQKAVVIEGNTRDGFDAYFIQPDESNAIAQGFGQVLESRWYATEKYALRFAAKRLS